jgi:hypothetical protein
MWPPESTTRKKLMFYRFLYFNILICTFAVVSLLKRFVCKNVGYVFTEYEYDHLKVSYVGMP